MGIYKEEPPVGICAECNKKYRLQMQMGCYRSKPGPCPACLVDSIKRGIALCDSIKIERSKQNELVKIETKQE